MVVLHLHAEGAVGYGADSVLVPHTGIVVGVLLTMTSAGATFTKAEVSQIPMTSLNPDAGYTVQNRTAVLAEMKCPAATGAVPVTANLYVPVMQNVFMGSKLYLNVEPVESSSIDAYVFLQ